jgi:cyclohexadieny/prephenate dehydrogenase
MGRERRKAAIMDGQQSSQQARSVTSAYLPIDKLVILGLGLIGGSLAAALRARGQVSTVVGWGRREGSLARGKALGYIDEYTLDLAQALEGADVVVIATPTLVGEKVLAMLPGKLDASTIVTDVASVKGSLLRVARSAWGTEPANLVLAHPIAGSEQSGVEAAQPDLFVRHRVILTPTAATSDEACAKIRAMWQSVGAEVVDMTVEGHDEVLAATSHLPHILAYTLVDNLARQDSHDDIFRFAAGGFRDFTRIASSDPQMWHDISIANRAALLGMIDSYSDHLARLRRYIDEGDSEQIMALYSAAKASRDRFAAQRDLAAGAEE